MHLMLSFDTPWVKILKNNIPKENLDMSNIISDNDENRAYF